MKKNILLALLMSIIFFSKGQKNTSVPIIEITDSNLLESNFEMNKRRSYFSDTLCYAISNCDTINQPIFPPSIFVCKRDTIVYYSMSYNEDNIVTDSALFIKYKHHKWLSEDDNGDFSIAKFKKIRPSNLFIKCNSSIFYADYEVDMTSYRRYTRTGLLKQYRITIGHIAFTKQIPIEEQKINKRIVKIISEYNNLKN